MTQYVYIEVKKEVRFQNRSIKRECENDEVVASSPLNERPWYWSKTFENKKETEE